jgi:hypothetical protein
LKEKFKDFDTSVGDVKGNVHRAHMKLKDTKKLSVKVEVELDRTKLVVAQK